MLLSGVDVNASCPPTEDMMNEILKPSDPTTRIALAYNHPQGNYCNYCLEQGSGVEVMIELIMGLKCYSQIVC